MTSSERIEAAVRTAIGRIACRLSVARSSLNAGQTIAAVQQVRDVGVLLEAFNRDMARLIVQERKETQRASEVSA